MLDGQNTHMLPCSCPALGGWGMEMRNWDGVSGDYPAYPGETPTPSRLTLGYFAMGNFPMRQRSEEFQQKDLRF